MNDAWVGHRLDCRDSAAGKIVAVIGEGPEWILVRTGRLGGTTAVPAVDAVEGARAVWVPYPRELIRNAPKVEQDKLDAAAERGLREHYGVGRA
jgi:hypothetical protein